MAATAEPVDSLRAWAVSSSSRPSTSQQNCQARVSRERLRDRRDAVEAAAAEPARDRGCEGKVGKLAVRLEVMAESGGKVMPA
jgi:hypothetical protein